MVRGRQKQNCDRLCETENNYDKKSFKSPKILEAIASVVNFLTWHFRIFLLSSNVRQLETNLFETKNSNGLWWWRWKWLVFSLQERDVIFFKTANFSFSFLETKGETIVINGRIFVFLFTDNCYCFSFKLVVVWSQVAS